MASNSLAVCLWSRNSEQVKSMDKNRSNQAYLPEFKFPQSLHVTTDLNLVAKNARIIIIAVPSHGFSEILHQLCGMELNCEGIISATKGIDPNSNDLQHNVFKKIINQTLPFGILSGPSFAK